ncbi:MAG TPA: hypothetical protein VEL76_27180 [Gemmataceae bacterium]|nr:hypothetical protein [Gemmataceae bacterium]
MHIVYGALFVSVVYPLWLAWVGNRHTTLLQAINWTAAAWLAWLGVLAFTAAGERAATLDTARYLALCLTGCAGVAVLGARRPGVGAWNFVLLGLLAVMLLPVAQGLLLGGQPLDPLRLLFLGATLAVGFLNYLPTRLAPAAILLAAGCGWELASLANPPLVSSQPMEGVHPGWLCVALAPWVGLLVWRRGGRTSSEFDRIWLDFRDRFGLVWSQRVREQFNRAAANAGWPVTLYWQGLLRSPGATLEAHTQDEIVAALRALLKRFGPDSCH